MDPQTDKRTSIINGNFFGGRAWLEYHDRHADERGNLDVFDFDRMPFNPCRSFLVQGVPAGTVRGGHMHRSGMQMLSCLNGRIEIMMRYHQEEITLMLCPDSPALILQSGVWCQQKYVEENSILLVFASEPYTPTSYINHWNKSEVIRNRSANGIVEKSCDD